MNRNKRIIKKDSDNIYMEEPVAEELKIKTHYELRGSGKHPKGH